MEIASSPEEGRARNVLEKQIPCFALGRRAERTEAFLDEAGQGWAFEGRPPDFLTCSRGWQGDILSQHFCVCQLKLQRQPKGGLTLSFC